LTDAFLGGQFLTYGLSIVQNMQENNG
jgi:hypothetical protein